MLLGVDADEVSGLERRTSQTCSYNARSKAAARDAKLRSDSRREVPSHAERLADRVRHDPVPRHKGLEATRQGKVNARDERTRNSETRDGLGSQPTMFSEMYGAVFSSSNEIIAGSASV